MAGIFWTLAAGGTLVLPGDDDLRDPRRLARPVASARVTTLLCVPSLYAQMQHFGADDLRGLTTVIVASERCPPQLVRDHFRFTPLVRLFNEYGPTEATVWATVQELTASDGDGPVAIGQPIPGVCVHVLDAMGRRVPAGLPGDGFIAGATVAEGYWRRPDLTRERFVVDPEAPDGYRRLYRTGDVSRGTRMVDSCSWNAQTTRSRYAASGSNPVRSRRRSSTSPGSRRPPWWRGRLILAAPGRTPTVIFDAVEPATSAAATWRSVFTGR